MGFQRNKYFFCGRYRKGGDKIKAPDLLKLNAYEKN